MKKVNYLFVLLAILGLNISAHAQTLRLNVQKGQVFIHDINLTSTLAIQAKDIDMNIDVPVFATLKYEVVSHNADTTVFKTELTALKFDFNAMGKSYHFDSQKDSAENGKTAPLMQLLNKPVEIHYDSRRQITNIANDYFKFEAKSKTKEIEVDSIVIDDEEFEPAMENEEVKIVLTEENDNPFSSFFQNKSDEEKIYAALTLLVFPEKEVKKGMKWKKHLVEEGVSSITVYKVTNTSQAQTIISSNTKNHINLNKLELGKELKGLKVKIKKHSSENEMVFNNQTGWLNSLHSVSLFSAQAHIKDTKATATLTVKYDVSVRLDN
ncbi:MAG: hypothetical protein LBR55_04690 [Bacteroidales bacterium]|jgi:hypothetical protein|nr:hypothetical protein [Bacteroidales bacterium]